MLCRLRVRLSKLDELVRLGDRRRHHALVGLLLVSREQEFVQQEVRPVKVKYQIQLCDTLCARRQRRSAEESSVSYVGRCVIAARSP